MTVLAPALVALHLAASLVLAAYGLHRVLLAWRYVTHVSHRPRHPPHPPDPLPSVTVQLPLYNERYVAERAVAAAGALEYPRNRLEVQVLDDSTDDTTEHVARAVAQLRAAGVRAVHVRRQCRAGYKAGALAHGLTRASGTLIAIFDADFVPPSDFLLRLVGEFCDPSVGMVQARWDHLNADTSILTRAQALQLDAHFAVEHGVREARGCYLNFNGTAGIWRREAIEAAGGWHADTLTEDLDLSYRAQLAGWRFVYRDDVAAPAELPAEVTAYRIQQQRWAQGGVQTARKMLPVLWRAPIGWRVKCEAFWHLTAHLTYPLLLVLAVAGLAAGWVAGPLYREWLLLADGGLLGFATAALGVFYGVAARARDPARWPRRLALVPVIMILGAGIALGQSLAVLRGLGRRDTPFQRTPKYRLRGDDSRSWHGAAYRLRDGRAAVVELALGAGTLAVASGAIFARLAVPSGPAFICAVGWLAVGGWALLQRRGAAPPRVHSAVGPQSLSAPEREVA